MRQLLAEAGVEAEAPEAAPAAGSLFRETLAELYAHDPRAEQRVMEELAYLANVLVAGDTSAAHGWRPVEAAERVLALCDAGLRALADQEGSAQEVLLRWGAVGVFRVAWASRSRAG